VLVNVPDENLIPLESALAKLAPSGLRVSIERGAAAESERPRRVVTLEIVGNERPGIVRDVTQALTRLGVNIEEFTSGLEGEPFTGVELFRATARLGVPEGLKNDDLRKTLERLAAEIMVDLTVGEGEPAP
jgi:glycine cleavage system regulatory protein